MSIKSWKKNSNNLKLKEKKRPGDAAAQKFIAELEGKLTTHEQQIQLLEKERVNLRDQIAFLQGNLQMREQEWQEKFDTAQTIWSGKRQDLTDKYQAVHKELTRKEQELEQIQQELVLANETKEREWQAKLQES